MKQWIPIHLPQQRFQGYVFRAHHPHEHKQSFYWARSERNGSVQMYAHGAQSNVMIAVILGSCSHGAWLCDLRDDDQAAMARLANSFGAVVKAASKESSVTNGLQALQLTGLSQLMVDLDQGAVQRDSIQSGNRAGYPRAVLVLDENAWGWLDVAAGA